VVEGAAEVAVEGTAAVAYGFAGPARPSGAARPFRWEASVVSETKNVKADDLDGAEAGVLDLIVEESDKRIGAQVQLMLANDLRANGILAAAATLAAGAFALAASQLGKDGNTHILAASVAVAVLALAATIAATWSLLPKPVDVQGWSPHLFVLDIQAKKSAHRIKAEIAALNQEKLNANEILNKELARRIRWAMGYLAASPVAGGVVLLISGLRS
jgi:hypothetical protein